MVNTSHYQVRQGQASTAAQQGRLTNKQEGNGDGVRKVNDNNTNGDSSKSKWRREWFLKG